MSISRLVRMEQGLVRNPLKTLERVKGIEPSSSAWKAVALPLSYTRIGSRSCVHSERCRAASYGTVPGSLL